MDTTLKATHGAGYTFLMGFMLAVVALVFSACPFAQKQYVLEKDIVREDGTVIPAGTPVYEDAEGNPTTEVTDKPYMETDVEKLEGVVKSGTKLADALPYGIGAVIGAIGMAGINAARSSRKKKREEVDGKLKKTSKAA